MTALMMTASCLITNPTSYVNERPLTPPRVRDVAGTTRPRIGNLVVVSDAEPDVRMYVPVDDTGSSDPLQWLVFLNTDRDCNPTNESNCGPLQSGEIAGDGATTRRYVEYTLRGSLLAVGCNRVEMWVSSRFLLEGDRHTPAREGDVDFATWWVFKPDATMGSTVDPVEACAQRVQP